jgi:hypothetical protein
MQFLRLLFIPGRPALHAHTSRRPTACGKSFQQIYDGNTLLGDMFASFWSTVAARFNGHAGVLAYETLNEPWVGDHVDHPDLLLKAGVAEKQVHH